MLLLGCGKMKENNKKINLKKIIILGMILMICIIIGLLTFHQYFKKQNISRNVEKNNEEKNESSNEEKYGKWLNFSREAIDFKWNDGTYEDLGLESRLFKSYDELEQYFTNLETKIDKELEFNNSYSNQENSVYQYFENFDFNNDSLILWVKNNNSKDIMHLQDVYIDDDDNLTVLIDQVLDSNKDFDENNKNADVHLDFIILKGNKGESAKFLYKEIDISDMPLIGEEKPIIYLYPKEDTKVSVKLLKEKNLTYTYPKYKDEWRVIAYKNGNLKDLDTNRQLYSLYYESKNDIKFKIEKEGFVVKGEDTIEFLEEKLDILGLNEREAEEFIIYWLPRLAANKYNYIRFATLDEINKNMPLEIKPNPDTIIRVLMTFKKLEKPITVQEQHLETINRNGFVAVEWGGTEIK